MDQAVGNLSSTIPLQSLLREAEYKPFNTLAACPLEEVRNACLETLRRQPYGRIGVEASRDRIEELIRAFRKAHDHIWQELFNWYVHFAGEGKNFDASEGARAIEFAIALSKEDSSVLHEAAKVVADKLRQRPHLYWEAARVSAFLKLLLLSAIQREKGYGAGTWRLTERAIRRIIAAEDVSFLGHIEELYRLHRDGTIKPDEFYQHDDPFARVQNEALLAETVRRLGEASNEQTPDLGVTVGSILRQKAGLKGSVVVEVECPSRLRAGQERHAAAVRIAFRATKDSEREMLLAALGKVTVELQSDGSLEVQRQNEEPGYGEWHMIGDGWSTATRSFTDKPDCKFLVRLCPGRRRLWLTFKDGKTELAVMAAYITFE